MNNILILLLKIKNKKTPGIISMAGVQADIKLFNLTLVSKTDSNNIWNFTSIFKINNSSLEIMRLVFENNVAMNKTTIELIKKGA